ncbi:metal-sulfur cluster assembly factor [Bacillus sp. T3]|uniref:metal-sulfur cluster assembly factor n=1 Tax=Bacillus sp. T3 TaxID=467262 RepID=UPI002982A7F7|nr:metal-sulfur cluster assembly factor [Bacillus sp. T3]
MSEKLVEKIYEVLEEVLDPELGIDIVNLGLVYEVKVSEELDVEILMTMTSMGCPLAGQIVSDVKIKLSEVLKELRNIDVQIVWSPAWTKDKMSRYAKIALGVRD